MAAPRRFGYSIYLALRRLLLGPEKPQRGQKRICARCHLPIKRNHKWSAQRLLYGIDGHPQHRDCLNPTGEAPPPISTEVLGVIEPGLPAGHAEHIESMRADLCRTPFSPYPETQTPAASGYHSPYPAGAE